MNLHNNSCFIYQQNFVIQLKRSETFRATLLLILEQNQFT